MGEVYQVEDTELNRTVAFKSLPAHLSADDAARRRFKREAQAAAKLSHPNIVTIHEVNEYQGRPFFAMQHIEGERLDKYIAEHKLHLAKIIELVVQARNI